MQYMILRRADDTSESPDFPSPELKAAVPGAKWLQHSASAVRMKRTDGEWSFSEGPFDDVAVAGFTFVEAPNRASAEAHAIARYIFPGGELDHIGMTVANMERRGFEVHDIEAWREHYARTTRLWHDRLIANFAAAEREVGAVKTRMWLIYLAGVSIAFDRAKLGIFQTVASKRRRGASGVPLSRADLYR